MADSDSDSTRELARESFAQQLGAVEPFNRLGSEELVSVASRFDPRPLAAGETLVSQGDVADEMYVLLSGALSVSIFDDADAERHIADLEPGDLVGEIALVAGGRRSATVRAESSSLVAALSAHGFNHLLDTHPEMAAELASLVTRRLREGQLTRYMMRLFMGLQPTDVRELERAAEWVSLEAGEVLFEQGAAGDRAYFVVSGRLIAESREADGTLRIIGEVDRGELVGEYAILLDEPRSATVVATRDTDLAAIPRDVFERLVDRYPKILLELTRTIIRRAEPAVARARRRRDDHVSIAVVPLDERVDIAGFVASVVAELSKYGDTIELDAARVDQILEKPGIAQSRPGHPAQIRLLQWLSQLESMHRFVVFKTAREFDAWTERAIRHADRVVYVADSHSDCGLRDVEVRPARFREKSVQDASLVLLHAADTLHPTGTRAWLEPRNVDCVYHVRRENTADMARFGRILAGRALGLVLGGGGARGFAHLGVLRALEELGIPIDMIGGTSIGAPIAIAPARGFNAAESTRLVDERFRSLLDYTLPIVSLLAGAKISRSINAQAGTFDIEDLWLPYYCVSTDITAACETAHVRGSLARAVRASVSIPGVLPPVPSADHLLVDGGVLNNLPIDVMRRRNPTGPIIAVDVVPREGPKIGSDYGLSVSGWRLAAARIGLRRRESAAPSMGATIIRTMVVGAERARETQREAELADLYLSIRLKGVGLLDFERVTEVAQMGYEQALAPIKAWREDGGHRR